MEDFQSEEHVLKNQLFNQLVERRARWVWSLMFIALASYFSLTSVVAWRPSVLHHSIGSGSVITFGIALAVGAIVLGWILTWLYTRESNANLDEIGARLLEEISK